MAAPNGAATVLVIEPHADSAHIYAETLRYAGFHVESAMAGDGGASIERKDLTPDVVVIGVNRIERPLARVYSGGRPVPQIVLSSDARDMQRASEIGCAAVLIRPVLYPELITTVRRVLKADSARQSA